MKDSNLRASQRSRHGTRSASKDRDRKRSRDKRDRERDRERDRDRYRDRDYSSRHHRSKSPTHSRSSSSRNKKSKTKKSKKHRHSSSESHSSDNSSNTSSNTSRNSRRSNTSRISKKSSSRSRQTRAASSEGNSSSMPASATVTTKPIDLNDIQVRAALETIEEDQFVPRAFFSTRDREAPEKSKVVSDKVVIDLNTETISMPKITTLTGEEKEEIFHPGFLGDPQQKTDKWIKKLFNYRQKCFRE